MIITGKLYILVAVAVLAAAVVLTKDGDAGSGLQPDTSGAAPLPKVVDLGATMCIPCRTMMTELERLEEMTQGTVEIEFIDINKDPASARSFGIRVIPTQVFLSESGAELWRHEGVISAEDMVSKWRELGYALVRD
ncbi:thioredoxin family protein [Candidatus Fermentibacteria bacterium]|nr:thioredoxin family protein [Candidatus Fermentibacteria bacterium]